MTTVKAGYICQTCKLDRWFQVRERAPEEGIENYVYHVGRMAGEDHAKNNVGCPTQHLDIKLPISANGIGMAGPELTEEEKKELAAEFNHPPSTPPS